MKIYEVTINYVNDDNYDNEFFYYKDNVNMKKGWRTIYKNLIKHGFSCQKFSETFFRFQKEDKIVDLTHSTFFTED